MREAANLLESLGEENRLQITALLAQCGELSVTALCEATGLSKPALSHHLAVLRIRRIIECRRQGRFRLYQLRSSAAEQVLRLLCGTRIVRSDEPQRPPLPPHQLLPNGQGEIQGNVAGNDK